MNDVQREGELLTLKQIQAEYGRSYTWWWRRVGSVVPATRYGTDWVVTRGDVEAYLATLSPKT